MLLHGEHPYGEDKVMSEEEILSSVFGEYRPKPKERIVAHRVLQFCAENPHLLPIPERETEGELLPVIQSVVEEMYGNPFGYYFRRDRHREILEVRHRVLKIYQEMSGKPIIAVAREFGFNHSTLVHAFKKVSDLCEVDKNFRREYGEMKRKINERLKCVK